MMEEEFFSTIKLTSGEEIIAKVCYLPDENSVLVENPMLVEKLTKKHRGNSTGGFILKEWINSTYDTLFVIKMEQIITMSELDKKIKNFYLNNIDPSVINKFNEDSIKIKPKEFSNQMGYLGSVKKTKEFLEDIYKKS